MSTIRMILEGYAGTKVASTPPTSMHGLDLKSHSRKVYGPAPVAPPARPRWLLAGLGWTILSSLATAGAIGGLDAGIRAHRRRSAAKTFPLVMQDLERRRSLTPDERVRAAELFDMLKKFGPSLANDKNVALSFIAQALPMSTEGTWQLLHSVTKTQQQVNDAQPSLAGPLALAATATKATARAWPSEVSQSTLLASSSEYANPSNP